MLGGLVGKNSAVAITNCYATGNVEICSYAEAIVSVGGLIGDKNSNSTITNCYRHEGQVIRVINNGVESGATNTEGTTCTLAQLNSSSFYTDTLDWDSAVWNVTQLDFENERYPMLKS